MFHICKKQMNFKPLGLVVYDNRIWLIKKDPYKFKENFTSSTNRQILNYQDGLLHVEEFLEYKNLTVSKMFYFIELQANPKAWGGGRARRKSLGIKKNSTVLKMFHTRKQQTNFKPSGWVVSHHRIWLIRKDPNKLKIKLHLFKQQTNLNFPWRRILGIGRNLSFFNILHPLK